MPDPRLLTFRRQRRRGTADSAVARRILESGILCHVAVNDGGTPIVVPMLYWLVNGAVYLHGSRNSRLIKLATTGNVCVTVTHLDGIVFAHSAFHHSANYRSVMVFGKPTVVAGSEAQEALRAFVERLAPGRWDKLRPLHEREIRATRVLRLSLDYATAKIRSGDPVEDPEDLDWPCWAGILPLHMTASTPQSVGNLKSDHPPEKFTFP